MKDAFNKRVSLSIFCGLFYLIVSLVQILISLTVLFTITMLDDAVLFNGMEDQDHTHFKLFSIVFAATGVVLSTLALTSGFRCFYRRSISSIYLIACASICLIIAALCYWISGWNHGPIYMGTAAIFIGLWLGDRYLGSVIVANQAENQKRNMKA